MLEQINFVGRTVGRLRLGQGSAERLVTRTLSRLGYEIGETVTKDGARYLISKTTKDGVSHALEILADGTVNAVRVRGFGTGITVIRQHESRTCDLMFSSLRRCARIPTSEPA